MAAVDFLARALGFGGQAQPPPQQQQQARPMIVQQNVPSPLIVEALLRGAQGDGRVETVLEGVGNLAQALVARNTQRLGQKSAADAFSKASPYMAYALAGLPQPAAPGMTPAADGSQAYAPAPTSRTGVVMPEDWQSLDQRATAAGIDLGAFGGSGPRGIRNNNPGNIEAGTFAKAIPGYQGSDGRFAQYASPTQGIAAIDRLLTVYNNKHGLDTVAGIIGRWAPAGENNTNAYAQAVARGMGVDPNARLDMADPNVRKGLIAGIIQHENGTNPYGDLLALVGTGGGSLGSTPAVSPPTAPRPSPVEVFRSGLEAGRPPQAPQMAAGAAPAPRAPQGGAMPPASPGSPQAPQTPDFSKAPPGGIWDRTTNSWYIPPNAAPNAPPAMDKATALQVLTEAASNPWNSPQQAQMYELAIQKLTAAPNYSFVDQNGTLLRIDQGTGEVVPIYQAPAAAVSPVAVGGRLVNPQTGQVVYEPPPEQPRPAGPMEVGGRIVDPNTGRVIYEGAPAPAQPLVVGGRVLDPVTFQPLYEPPPDAPPRPDPFTLSPGQVRYGPDGRQIAAVPEPPPEQFRPLVTPQDRAAYGLAPTDTAPYQIGPDNKLYKVGDGGTSLTVNTGPTGIDYGDPPKDMAWRRNPDGTVAVDDNGAPVAVLIQGSPTWQEQQTLAGKASGADASAKGSAELVVQDIGRALNLIDTAQIPVTGIGSLASAVPGTPAHDLSQLLDTISANIAFDKLQEMRNNSPTGGALGAVTERELSLLSAAKGAVAQSQSATQLKDNLARLNNLFLDVIHGKGNGPARMPLSFEQNPGGPQPGTIEDGYRFKGGDPANPNNWEPVN